MNKIDYYLNDEVLFEIVKTLVGRETAFFGESCGKPLRIRCIKAHNINFLRENMRRFDFLKDNTSLNIYYSLAHYYNMPMFSFNMEERRKQMEQFRIDFSKYQTGFDFGIDFDAENVSKETLIDDMITIKKEFDKNMIPYTLKCSGSGFHINIESKYFDSIPFKDRLSFFSYWNNTMADTFICDSICGSTKTMIPRHLWKAPYSYDVKSGNIALPLTDEQANNFNWDIVTPKNVILNGVRNRGTLERKGETHNILKFLRRYDILKEEDLDGSKQAE